MQLQTPLPISIEALFIIQVLKNAGYDAYIVGGAVRDLILASWSENSASPDIIPTDYDLTTNATPEEIQALFPESFYENDFGTVAIARKHLWEQMGATMPDYSSATTQSTEDRVIDVAAATKVHDSLQESVERAQRRMNKDDSQEHALFEITTYRSKEVYDSNFRKPDSLEWGEAIQEDLTRRDFTINAMALSVTASFLEQDLSQAIQSDETPTELEVTPSELQLVDTHQGYLDLKKELLQTVGCT